LLKSYREDLSSRVSLVITHNFMILCVWCRWSLQSRKKFIY